MSTPMPQPGAATPATDGHRPHAVFFDAGDTILAAHPTFQRRFAQVAAEAGATFEQAAIDAAYAEAVRRSVWPVDWGDAAGQERFWKDFYRRVLVDLGYRGDLAGLVDAMYTAFSDPLSYRLFADTMPVLDELERRGIVIGVVSNFEPWLRDILEHQDILHRLSAVAISGELRVAKPDPAIFRHALEQASVAPERTVYVGDSPEADVAGARAAGMRPVLIDRFGRHPVADAPRITALPELLAVIDALDGSG